MHDPANLNSTISQLTRLAQAEQQHPLQGDLELLELYVGGGDRAALAALITRYAPLVASVCSLTVADRQLAEDAFQATFLILLRQAHKIRRRSSLAAWLHGVAYRCGCRVRKQLIRERVRAEQHCRAELEDDLLSGLQKDSDPLLELSRKMNLEALDRELQALPEHLSAPLVEHYLMGLTAPQIAERMELSVSAVEGRLRRGRQTLRARLARRGISLSVLSVGCSLFQEHLSAATCSHWTLNFTNQHLPRPVGGTADEASVASPGPLVSSLIQGETSMLGSSSIKASCVVGILSTVGIAVALSAGTVGQGGSTHQNNRVLTVPIADSQLPVVAQLVPLSSNNALAAVNAPLNEPAYESDASSGVSTTWQRPATGAEEPSWLVGGRAAQEDIEQNRKALYLKLDYDFNAVPLQQVAEWLTEETGTHFALNVSEIELGGMADIDSPITAKGYGSVREIIRHALGGLELTYVVNESNIEITTKDDASDEPLMRCYELSFVLPDSASLAPLMTAIQQSVTPLDWDVNGGQATISVIGSMLIVNAPDTAHHRIEVMLSNISQMNPLNLEKKGSGAELAK